MSKTYRISTKSGMDFGAYQGETAADALRQCWSGYEQKSLTPAEKRFVAGACESMEEKFVQKHGRRP